MNQVDITKELVEKYSEFVQRIHQLSEEAYLFHPSSGKWNAAQHLKHLVLAVQPLVYVYTLPVATIEAKFGRAERRNQTYEELKAAYLVKLKEGGKAPEQFVPQEEITESKEALTEQLMALISQYNAAILKLTTADFESLQIPHPLLGLITLKEMAYNASYHVEHHYNGLQLAVNG
ncbi:DinB family protein [Myroides odoratus]|uniref:DinB family protein n=1 Tax=Myroides odoratus TaxID=256 RepID=A0A9Q6Z5P7_MYROD|nr:DinB family protein [Myroides odoratus]EHQ41313.1 hypothetical protein Myrod_0477 [Myroides odoratus DSM 2801]EKB08593.1 hypothetical protein HMPREF9716_00869 [Myroides odoratus CIP 103059]QQT98751.1 DinB family protein [Myroides odoratus]WQD59067.1 DinB family protein [Myroides odoratus]STZ32353.1 DinB superfamily [Myroides odoratus]